MKTIIVSNGTKLVILAILCIWSVWVFFPGSYSIDSWQIFDQAVSGQYNDWHAVIFPFLWKLLYKITGKIYAIYICQMILYWVFAGLLLIGVNKNSLVYYAGIVVFIGLLFIPQYVMKDSMSVLTWGIAVCLIVLSVQHGKYRWLYALVSLILIVYGLWLRSNAIVAAIVLFYLYANIFLLRKGKWWVLLITAISLCVMSMWGSNLFTYKVMHAEKRYPQYKLKLLDIEGVSILSGQSYMPACVTRFENYNADSFAAAYTPASIDDIYWPPSGKPSILPMPDERLNNCVDSAWKTAIITHPALYMKNRVHGFIYYLRIRKRFSDYWNVALWVQPYKYILKHTDNWFYRKFGGVSERLSNTLFFDPWLWLIVNTFLWAFFAWLYKKRGDAVSKILMLVMLSGILYMMSQLFVYQHDRDFRYNYWNVIVVAIGITGVFIPKGKKIQ